MFFASPFSLEYLYPTSSGVLGVGDRENIICGAGLLKRWRFGYITDPSFRWEIKMWLQLALVFWEFKRDFNMNCASDISEG